MSTFPKLSFDQTYALARSVGCDNGQATVATAIAAAESGLDPENTGDLTLSHFGSVGEWQVFTHAHSPAEMGVGSGPWTDALVEALEEPYVNAHAMWLISNHGKTWHPWSTFNDGAYRSHMQAAEAAAARVGGNWANHLPARSSGPIPTQGGDNEPASVKRAEAESINPSQDWTNRCLVFVRTCFGLPADGREPTAASSWVDCPAHLRHPGDAHPPAGVPCVWSGGSSGAGHIAVSDGNGHVWSSDIQRTGKVDLVPLTEIHARWGEVYEGWMEELEGHVIYHPGTPAPTPTPVPVPQPTPGPVVSLANIIDAAQRDPAAPQGETTHPADVRLVEAALRAEGLLAAQWAGDGAYGKKTIEAYAKWQLGLGYSGKQADGIPGHASLFALGRKHGWIVV